jgi:hypothetical protein
MANDVLYHNWQLAGNLHVFGSFSGTLTIGGTAVRTRSRLIVNTTGA